MPGIELSIFHEAIMFDAHDQKLIIMCSLMSPIFIGDARVSLGLRKRQEAINHIVQKVMDFTRSVEIKFRFSVVP